MYTTSASSSISPADAAVLVALFELGRRGRAIHLVSLARELGTDVRGVLAALARLEVRGLADVRRVRLTMLGLGVAARTARARTRPSTRAA